MQLFYQTRFFPKWMEIRKGFCIKKVSKVISKIKGCIIHDQTMDFSWGNDGLYKFQSDFKKFSLTGSCLSHIHEIIAGFNSGILTRIVMSFLGFADEMCTTSHLSYHLFLVRKMHIWIKHKQHVVYYKVQVRRHCSSHFISTIYYSLCKVNGDTCLVFQNEDIKVTEVHLNRDFSAFVDWFVDNKPSVILIRTNKNQFTFSKT